MFVGAFRVAAYCGVLAFAVSAKNAVVARDGDARIIRFHADTVGAYHVWTVFVFTARIAGLNWIGRD